MRRRAAPVKRVRRPGAACRGALSRFGAAASLAAVQGHRSRMAREGLLIILGPLIQIILIAIKFYIWVVIAWIIMSWLVNFNVVNRSNRLVHALGDILHRLTEPALKPIRRYMPNLGGLDLTPMALILILIFVQLVLGNVLWSLPQAGH